MTFEPVRNEELCPGDNVRLWCGHKTIVRIDRYDGPLRDLIFAVAVCEPRVGKSEWGFSLERGGCTDRLTP